MAKSSKTAQDVGFETKPILAELVGTFLLTGAVLAAVISQSVIAVPIIVALTLAVLVLAIGPISGSHVNPAVTLGLLSVGKINLSKALGYWVAQIAGALLALITVTSLAGTEITNLIDKPEGFEVVAAEALGTAIFLFGIVAVVSHKLNGTALSIGVAFSLFIGIVFASVASAGVLNPAIALALSAVGGIEWHYIVGPFVGAAIGALVYKYVFADKE